MAIETSELRAAPAAESDVLGQLYAATYNWLGVHGEDDFGPYDQDGQTHEGLPVATDPPNRSYTIGLDAARRIVPEAVERLAIVEDLELAYFMPYYQRQNDESGAPVYELEQPDCSFTLTGEQPPLPLLVDFLTVMFDEETQQWVSSRLVDGGIPLGDTHMPEAAKPLWASQIKIVNDRDQVSHITQPEAEALVQIVENVSAIHEASS
jgi:hypothetical protein